MKLLLIIILLLPVTLINAQKIGELAPEKPPEIFPDNTFGVDIMFSEGGFGLGTFYRRALSQKLTGFADFSISESKDEKEVELVDIFGQLRTPGKKNRVFMMPLFVGLQYRLFENVLTDNLRPYFNIGVGPNFVFTTPYEKEFFNSFGDAHIHYAVGGYVGFGANFGLSKSNLLGVNLRYYLTHFFGEGVENLAGRLRNDIGAFYLTINVGFMY